MYKEITYFSNPRFIANYGLIISPCSGTTLSDLLYIFIVFNTHIHTHTNMYTNTITFSDLVVLVGPQFICILLSLVDMKVVVVIVVK